MADVNQPAGPAKLTRVGGHRERAGKGIARLTTLLLALVIAGVAVAAWGVSSDRYAAHPVLSGSMEPALPTGSIALVKRVSQSTLSVGDVLAFHEPGSRDQIVTHRIASIRVNARGARTFQTKGDANPGRDPWQLTIPGDTSYVLWADVPYAGFAVVWLRDPATQFWLRIAAGLILACGVVQLLVPDTSRRRRHRGPGASVAPAENEVRT